MKSLYPSFLVILFSDAREQSVASVFVIKVYHISIAKFYQIRIVYIDFFIKVYENRRGV